MSLDYNNSKEKVNSEGTFWSSYSDLFMVLSVIFLLLYVVASLRTTSQSIKTFLEHRELSNKNADLQEQIRVYNTLKDDAYQNEITKKEQESYDELMDKLELLQDDTRIEKEQLILQAEENHKKEKALNHYQQMVRNIINANIIQKSTLSDKTDQIDVNEQTIAQQEATIKSNIQKLAAHQKEITSLEGTIEKKLKALKQNESKISKLARARDRQIKKIEAERKKRKISKKRMRQKIAAMKKKAASEIAKLEKKNKAASASLAQTNAQLETATSNLKQAKSKETELATSLSQSKLQNKQISAALKAAEAKANARSKLAGEIGALLKKNGLDAHVDKETGEVIISFGKEYFDTGRAKLKKGMKKTLKKFIPLYAKSLFKDKKISRKIENVEIIGFASPTYRGVYVDPKSLDEKVRKAVAFNLDLSYNRARSIFTYIFNTKNMKYKNQKKLRSMIKVTGRSFLSEDLKSKGVKPGMKVRDFCKKYDCKKSQRVIIKFNLKD